MLLNKNRLRMYMGNWEMLKQIRFRSRRMLYFKGTKQDCEKYRLECYNQVSALVTDNCILDCTKKTGSDLTLEFCASINSQCSLSSRKNQCVGIKSSCSDYTSSTDCYKSTQSYCFYSNGSCIQITSVTDCQKVNSGVLSDSICKLYNSACTINQAGTSCQERKAACTNYGTTQADCSISTKGNCLWKDSTCIGIVKPAGSDMCQMKFCVMGSLKHSSCQDFNLGCTRNQEGSRCQFQDTVCLNYTKQSQCRASTNKYCRWKNNACIKSTDISTECELFSSLSISEVGCSNLLTDCINLIDNSGCQPIKTDCSGYQSENACNKISSIQCFWNSSCKSYASTAVCELIRKNNLTNEDCLIFSNNNCVIGDGKCQIKSATCAGYSTKQSCTYSTEDKCMWLNDNCFAISYPQIYEAVTTKGGKSYCEKQNSICTVNIEGYCQLRKAKCSDYQSSAKCSFSDEGRCFWNTAYSCSQVTGYNLRHDVCHSFHPECTIDTSLSQCKLNPRCKLAEANYDIDGKKCLRTSLPDNSLTSLKISKLTHQPLLKQANYNVKIQHYREDYGEECADATNAGKFCYIDNNICMQITSKSQCSQFIDKDVTDQQCTSVLNGCVPNFSLTQCQEQKQTCGEYLTKDTCTQSVETYRCVFSILSSTCINSPPCPQLASHLQSIWDCSKYGCTTLDGQCGNKGDQQQRQQVLSQGWCLRLSY
ncbi:unnamed protein product [Paramecium octaurelia]|uniref:Uncharacterized protein n=1 Tax=Paramecium octaurelia TaxID=43137 RepID=A0A8S1URN0_PAROT|nr:unnamed protein product [Paramecium octaurelia]